MDHERIDRISDAFESALRAGARPAIESFLTAVAEPDRSELLRELLAVEVEYRVSSGERPTPADYLPRFPGHAELVHAAFRKPAAGGPSLTLTVTEGPHRGRTFTLAGHDTFLVGRSRQAHLMMPAGDRYFSRIHFLIEFNPPLCRLTDTGSHNGTFVNGRRVVGAVDLRDGDQVKAGHTVFTVSLPTPNAAGPEQVRTITLHPQPATAMHQPTTSPANEVLPTIPGYEIIRELGRGAMGIVCEAVHRADRTRCAIKTVVPAVAASPVLVERFLREARILCQLDHPHIVRFRAMGESDGLLWFAMDHIEGSDAARLLKQHGPLPLRTAVRMTCQLLTALAYAHDKGFVHRDIKPANILLTESGSKKVVKLADFGLARVYQASQLSGLTVQGEVGGTFAFMPPEQVTQFRNVRPTADQYAAAATLYNLLTDCYLHDFTQRDPAILTRILTEEPIRLEQRRPDLPSELAAVIHQALARDPDARFADVRVFQQALLPFTS